MFFSYMTPPREKNQKNTVNTSVASECVSAPVESVFFYAQKSLFTLEVIPLIALRSYQIEAIQAIKTSYEQGITRALLSLPTGLGKTVCFASLAQQMNRRTLILAHRDELITQAVDKLKMVWPDADVGVIKAKSDEWDKPVVVASVQTLAQPRRLERIAQGEPFTLCIVDESHRATAATYQRIFKALGFTDDDPDKLLLGVTATAYRSDGTALGNVFQDIVYHMPLTTAIREGYLSDLRGVRVKTTVDLSGVGTRHGDFIESQLSDVVNTPDRNRLVVQAHQHYAPDRKTIVFSVDVAHAEALADEFNRAGIPAASLSGDTPTRTRKDILSKFDSGEIQVLTNCAVLIEGFDQPDISCVIMARPTKSSVLYTQAVGRGTRKALGKSDCVVIDLFDNRHDVCALPTLFGLSEAELADGESVRGAIARVSKSQGGNITSVDVSEFDPLGRSQFRWFEADDEWWLPIAPGKHVILHRSRGGLYKVLLRERGVKKDKLLHQTTVSLGYAQGIAEDFARKNSTTFARRDASWRDNAPTQKQIDIVTSIGQWREGMTRGEASDILERYFATRKRGRRHG